MNDEYIFYQGDMGNKLFIIVKGEVTIYLNATAQDKIKASIGAVIKIKTFRKKFVKRPTLSQENEGLKKAFIRFTKENNLG